MFDDGIVTIKQPYPYLIFRKQSLIKQDADVSVYSGYLFNRIAIFTLEGLGGIAREVSLGMSRYDQRRIQQYDSFS